MRSIRIIGAAVAAAALLAACGGGAGSGTEAAGDTVTIGVLASQTGTFAAAGATHVSSIQLGVDKVNAAGGVTVGGKSYQLKLAVQDAASDPAKASAAAQTLLRDEGVKFLLGPGDTPTAQAVEPLAKGKDVVWVAGSTYIASKVEAAKGADGFENTFATNPSAGALYPAAVRGLLQFEPGTKTAAILWPAGAAADPYVDLIRKGFEDQGVQVVETLRFDATTQDFTTFLTRLKATNPDVLFTGTSTGPVKAIVSQASDVGTPFKAVIAQGVAAGIGLTGDNGGPLPFPYLYTVARGIDPYMGTQAVDGFYSDFAKSAGKPVDPEAQQYASEFTSSVEILAAAMEKAGSVDDPKAIAAAMPGLEVDAPTGKVSFSPSHVLDAPIAVCAVVQGNGTCKPVETASAAN